MPLKNNSIFSTPTKQCPAGINKAGIVKSKVYFDITSETDQAQFYKDEHKNEFKNKA